MKISNFLIMFAVIGMFVGVITLFYSGVGATYSKSYDNATLASFERFDEVQSTAQEVNTSITKVTQGNVVDVVGGLLQSGYTVLKSTWTGFSMYSGIAEDGINNARIGKSTTYFSTAAYLIGFLLFIFAIIAVLTGRDSL